MKRPTVESVPCSHCGGRGKIPGPTTGVVLSLERRQKEITRPQLVAHFQKPEGGLYSESYLFDLERDARPWTEDLITRYRKALQKAEKINGANKDQ